MWYLDILISLRNEINTTLMHFTNPITGWFTDISVINVQRDLKIIYGVSTFGVVIDN